VRVDRGGLTYLQYADDTIIFLEAEEQYIANVKFLLYCFENMSGLKINYQKGIILYKTLQFPPVPL
jgi:hypothetical protein